MREKPENKIVFDRMIAETEAIIATNKVAATTVEQSKKDTPMFAQYNEMRKGYEDCLLFFRLGDFYELFGDQAKIVSDELNLTLTARAGISMCGVPYHAVNSYIRRLLKKGYKIAIGEQMTDAVKGGSMIERSVVRVVTPGTLTEDNLLDGSKNNYLASFCSNNSALVTTCVFADVSTGELFGSVKSADKLDSLERVLLNEISAYTPTEIIFTPDFASFNGIAEYLKHTGLNIAGNCSTAPFSEVE
ncbi:MAG: hypothetical protein LBN42_02485, partial [Oscillospiraceae bacterium]|nr:hypothetical protein [Oscillospiraceae bacterium]